MKPPKEEKIFKNFIIEIAKPVFDRFSYVDNFKFDINNRHKRPDMLFIDSIHSVNGSYEWDMIAKDVSGTIYKLKESLYDVPSWSKNVSNKKSKIEKLIKELEVLQQEKEKEENKINAVLDYNLAEWKNRHDKFQDIIPIYYILFPMDTIEHVVVDVSRKGNVEFWIP